MFFRSTLLYLGIFSLLVAIFALLNILFSYYFDSLLNLKAYIGCLIISLFSAFILIFSNKKFINEKINFIEKLILVITGFFYFPLLISIPYLLSIYELSFINAYFESISGFTSTGFTILEDIKKIDEPFLIWRSSSQWLGGLYFLYALFLLTGSSKIKIKNIYSNYEGVNLSEIKDQYTKVLIIYIMFTFLVFLFLSISGIRLFESLNLSTTIVSSGGFIPSNNLTDILKTENQQIIFSLCMLIPLFNLYLIYNIFFGDKFYESNQEDFYLLILLIFVLITIYIFFNKIYGLNNILFAVLSSLSTIGLGLNIDFSNLSILFIILAIIGGASFSTTSGIKFIKLYALSKFSLNEIYLIVKPLQVSSNTLFMSKHKITDEEINNYFLVIVFFIIGMFVLSSTLSLEDINFKNSITLSILTISNTVNSSNYNLADFSFLNLNVFSKISLIFFMIVGRVELLSFLILIKKIFIK